MNTYKFFDINIKSDTELLDIPLSSSHNVDLNLISVNNSPINKNFTEYHKISFKGKPWVTFLKYKSHFAMRFQNFADFKISTHEKNIYSYRFENTSINTFTHLFADHVVPNILTLYDKMVFHSSTVKIMDSAVSFQAPSGVGKSTIAAYFSLKKHALISDDSLLVKKKGNHFMAIPCYPGIRLWPKSMELLFKKPLESRKVSQYNSKENLDPKSSLISIEKNPVRLKTIFFINISDKTDIELLSPTEALSLIIKNLYRLNFKDRKRNEFEFNFLIDMLKNVEFYKLNYKHESESIKKAYDIVMKHSIN